MAAYDANQKAEHLRKAAQVLADKCPVCDKRLDHDHCAAGTCHVLSFWLRGGGRVTYALFCATERRSLRWDTHQGELASP